MLGALGRDPHGKEGRHRGTRSRLRRANRGLRALREARNGSLRRRVATANSSQTAPSWQAARRGDCVAPLAHRGRWSPSEATALSTSGASGSRRTISRSLARSPRAEILAARAWSGRRSAFRLLPAGMLGSSRHRPTTLPLHGAARTKLSTVGYVRGEGLPRHRRRRRVQNPRAGCRAAHPNQRRARRGAPSRGRGLRQGGRGQEHSDTASRGRSAGPGAPDWDPGRGFQRPLAGAHGRCPGSGVRSRQSERSRFRGPGTELRSSPWAR